MQCTAINPEPPVTRTSSVSMVLLLMLDCGLVSVSAGGIFMVPYDHRLPELSREMLLEPRRKHLMYGGSN